MSQPVELPYETCRELISGSLVGRAAVCTPSGPQIVPVNYVVVNDSIIFRTAPYSVLGTYASNSPLAFEVDDLDLEHEQGWSVVAVGRGSMVEDPEELADIRSAWDPRPWAEGSRTLYIRLRWRELSGRRINASGWNHEDKSSAHRTG